MKKSLLDLTEKRNKIPLSPGVYLFKDRKGVVLYIGKAAALRKRVAQYFVSRAHAPKIAVMLKHVADIDYIETPTETDALILEASLINEYAPKYNTRLKDDKSYPFLLITQERYPRLMITRMKNARYSGVAQKGSLFGPYTDATLLKEAVQLIHATYPLRKCKTLPQRACVYYHIKQCIAPCIHADEDTKRHYDELMSDVATFLRSGKRSLVSFLSARMKEESDQLRFEEAGRIKRQIEALEKVRKKRFQIKRGIDITGSATRELKRALGLRGALDRIICFDVSNLMGKWATASKVSFFKELPDKTDYRQYRIKHVQGINDYDMMREVVERMVVGVVEKKNDQRPQLIMIDGGKGHLRAAKEVLDASPLRTIPVISLAKRLEMVFSANIAPLLLPDDSPALYLVKKIRDEAHRFAVDYHRVLRKKGHRQSLLDTIPGIGEQKKKALLRRFNSIEDIRTAGCEDLMSVPGISAKLATTIVSFLKGQ